MNTIHGAWPIVNTRNIEFSSGEKWRFAWRLTCHLLPFLFRGTKSRPQVADPVRF
jgi:hypothetical protein